jgi:hypothetical protein
LTVINNRLYHHFIKRNDIHEMHGRCSSRRDRLQRTTGKLYISKRLIVGALALCFFIDPITISITRLNHDRTIVKRDMENHIIAGIRKSDLVLLIFSTEETRTLLRWEHPREFEYKRQMYDIVETESLGDTVYYWCRWDQEETKLNEQLRELAAQALGEAPNFGDDHDSFVSSMRSFCRTALFYWKPSVPGSSLKRFCPYSDLYSSTVIQPPTPPPKLG